MLELDTLADRLIKKLQRIDVEVSVNDSQLEDALALGNDLGKLTPNIALDVDTGKLDSAVSEIGALESLTPNIAIAVDTGALDRAVGDLGALESLSPKIDVQVDAPGLGGIEADLDRLTARRTAIIDVDVTGEGAARRAIEGLGEDQTATIDIEADTSGAESSVAALVAAGGPIAAAGGAAAVIFGVAFGDALNLDAALGKVEAALGLTEAESQAIGAAAGDLYAGAYGESIADNLSVLEDLAKFELVATADVDDLTRAGGLVQDFANVFEVDAERAISGVQQLVEQGLASDLEDGLDGLTTALQNSKIPADEFIEAVGEYAPFLSDAGLSFEDFAGILQSGGASTVIEVDKVGDAIKELTLRVDGLTPEKIDEIAEAAGLAAPELQTLVERLQEGDPGALEDVIGVLQGIEDPAQQAAFSVELFGAAGEDAANILLNADFTTPFETIEGATEAAGNAVNDNLGVRLETLKRTALQGLTDFISATLLPKLTEFADFLLTIDFTAVGESAVGVFETIRTALSGLFENIDFAAIGETAGSIFDGLQTAAAEILPQIPPLIDQVGTAVGAVVELAVTLWATFGESITTGAIGAIEGFIQVLGGVLDVVTGVISGVTAILNGDWSAAWAAAEQIVSGAWEAISGLIEIAVTRITTTVQLFFDLFGGDASATMSAFTEIISSAWTAIQTVIGTAATAVTTVVTAAWTAISTATSVAWAAIGTVISTAWTAISTIVSTAMTAIQTVITTAWTAISTVIGTAMTAIQTVISTAWTAITTVIGTAMTAIQTVITTAWTAIRTAIQTAMTAISTLISTAWAAIRTAITTAMTAIRTVITTAWAAIRTAIATAMTAIRTLITTAWAAIRTAIATAITAIRTLVTTGFAAIRTAIATAMTAIRTAITAAWNAIRTTVTTSVAAIRTAAVTGFNGMRTAVVNTVNGIRTGIEGAFRAMRGAIEGIVAGIRDSVNRIFGGIRVPDFGGVIGAAQSAASTAGNIIGAIPGLAHGAIVKGSSTGTVVRLAENGADELALNAASSLNRKLDLLEKFDNGRLLRDLFDKWETEFSQPQQAAAGEFMRYAGAAPAGGDTNIEVTVVQGEARSKVQETRNALQIAREIGNEIAKVS